MEIFFNINKILDMKTVKVKNIFLGLLTIVALSTVLISCEQDTFEDLTPTTEKQLTEMEDRNFGTLSTKIVGTWQHSHEENTNPEVESVYRPDGFDFPASRGRNGFRFFPNGDFVYIYPDPTDELMERTGTWRAFGNQNILIFFDPVLGGLQFPRLTKIKVISIADDKLVIEPFNWY